MPGLSVTEEIAAPTELVFALATDLAGAGSRIRGIESIEVLTDGDFGVGTRWRETRKMMGKSATEEMTVTEFEPGRSYMTVAESNGCRYHSGLRCELVSAGTRVTYTFRGEAIGAFSRVMMVLMAPLNWMMTRQARKLIEADLADLRRAAEAASVDQAGG